MKFRLIWAIISVILEEIAIIVISLFVLPEFDIKISTLVLILIMIAWFVMSVLLYIAGIRALDKKPVDDLNCIVGKKGMVVKELNPKGLVKIDGELWGAEAQDTINAGEEIIVTGYTGIKLTVERVNCNVSGESE
jgi:membrane protein implicated in regulation of membrane protease activity